MCIARPRSTSLGSLAICLATVTTSSKGIPNLAVFSPVLVYGWLSIATSGLTRIPTRAVVLISFATAMSVASSLGDSILMNPTPARIASSISTLVLPTREHDAVWIEPRDPRPAQLANRHDVGARTELPEDTEHAEVAVGFDGEADAVADAVECVVERVVLRANQVGTVDVGRRPDAIRDCLEQ